MTEIFISFNMTMELYKFNPTHIVKMEFSAEVTQVPINI